MPGGPSYADIAEKLGDQVDSLVPRCLGAARIAKGGKVWECGGLDGRPGGKSWNLRVRRSPGSGFDRGSWVEYGTGYNGDALDLVAHALFGGDLRRAYQWALDFLGLDEGQPETAEEKRQREERQARERAERLAEAEAYERKVIRDAKALWLSGDPDIEGSPVDRYLLARGIDIRRITPRPSALRYHPACFNMERRERLPAMVAAISRPGPQGHGFIGCHRTWLQKATGSNDWFKADLETNKMVMGRAAGGLICLNRGVSGVRWSQMRRAEPCAIGEGIEDTLSAAIAQPDLRAACGVSLSNIGGLASGWNFSEVILLGQNDPPGSKAEKGLPHTISRLVAGGWRVRLASPPAGVKDWNDWLLQEQGAAA